MLRGDGRQRVWLQFTPDIPGTIRNHFLPICLIAAITYRSDLLSFPAPCVPSSDGSPIDLSALKISKRTERRPSRCASQLSTIYQPLVKGDSLSLFKDPIHSDLLKVLMLISLSLLASWKQRMGSCWEVRGHIIFYQTGPKYLHVPPSASFFSLWVLLSNFSILHGDLRGSRSLLTSSHQDYELTVFLRANLIYCSECAC